MIRKLKSMIMIAVLAMGFAVPLALPAVPAYAATSASKNAACEGIGLSGGNCGVGAEARVGNLIKTIVQVLSVIVGIAAVIMVIISGFKYITSGGDTNSIASAKNTLVYAIVGLIIVAISQFIVTFVLKRV